MKLLWGDKDGGPESHVRYYGLESKRFGSICLLLFGKGSRPVFHSHAFRSISWVLSGGLREKQLTQYDEGWLMMEDRSAERVHFPSFRPIHTYRTTYHKVEGLFEKTWVFSLRGPWRDRWYEYHPDVDESIVMTHGRKVVETISLR